MLFSEVHKKFVEQQAAQARAVPADARATSHEAPGSAAPVPDSLDIQLDGYPFTLKTSPASVRRVVGIAYLIGGFDLVVGLHARVQAAIASEREELRRGQAGLQWLTEEIRDRPQFRTRFVDAQAQQQAAIPRISRRLQIATNIGRLLHEAWARIAAAEEQVLRDYEPVLIEQFAELAKEAGELALREWVRYEPYDTTATADVLSTVDAKERSLDNLRLRNEPGELVQAIRELHYFWWRYLDVVGSSRKNDRANPAQAHKNIAAFFEVFDGKRREIGTRFPAALQVYGRLSEIRSIADDTRDETIEQWVIDALIDAVASSADLAEHAVKTLVFRDGVRLRVEPTDHAEAKAALPGFQEDVVAAGLTIPASRIIANRMQDVDVSARSAWFQLPVRLALFRRASEGDRALAPYATPGRLEHAALSEVNNALQEVRRKQKEELNRALLIMSVIAVPLGFLTAGGTTVVAGVINAIVRGREMYLTVGEYQARDALAEIALVPMQQAIWEHPSAVVLVGNLLEGGFEIATELVTGGAAGTVMDAIQVSLALGYGVQAVAEWAKSDDPLGGGS